MELEKLALDPRAGNPWEALDLGAAIQRRWWQPIFRVWVALYLPAAVILGLATYQKLWIGALMLWWLKPVFERFLLHVISRTIFGDSPNVRQTLSAWREILTPGLPRLLTLARFSPYRSFTMPVYQLERQHGREARERIDVLGRRARGTAGWNTLTCAHFEAILIISLNVLVTMFSPDNVHTLDADLQAESASWWEIGLVDYIFYAVGASIIAPLYVASGFALYLHRRTMLEGWDIELGLRRIQSRLAARARAASLVAVLFGTVFGAALVLAHPTPAYAAAPPDPKSTINEVLTAPEFGEHTLDKTWRKKNTAKEEAELPDWAAQWARFLANIGSVLRAIVWIALAATIIIVLWWARQFIAMGDAVRDTPYHPPDQLFGLDVRPQTLPADIAQAARQLLEAGLIRDALSLLYRATLSVLVHRHALELSAGDTEGDALRAARATLAPDAGGYLADLVAAWQATAYAARVPSIDAAGVLAARWSEHFATASTPPARA